MTAQYFQLSTRSGPNPGKVFPLEQAEILFGRDLANDIAIGDPEVSRRHARFFRQEDDFFIEDLGSTNGTFLNGERISSPKQLRAGDVITFGENIVMVFEKSSYDPDATIVAEQGPQAYELPQEAPPSEYEQAVEPKYEEELPEPRVEKVRKPKAKREGFPTWLMILIIAVVVLACVIAVTLYFMPASWWCAITFDMLEGCPVP